MSPKAMTFRFDEDIWLKLRTWAFVTGKEQKEILEEAFQEYIAKRPDIQDKVGIIMREIDQ